MYGRIALLAVTCAWSCLALAAPALTAATPESAGFSTQRLQRLDAYMQALVDDGHLPGATVMLARHGKVLSFKTFGKMDVNGAPMPRDAIFRVYSQTKVVTGVAMMMLFEEGEWRFDDPVTKFIPEFRSLQAMKGVNADGSLQLEDLQRPPTMRELLTHSAGFGYGLDTSTAVERAYLASDYMRAPSSNEAIARIAKLPMASQPGVRWHYSAAVDIQGYIIERLSGQSLAEFMRSRIFDPLKMKDTGFYVPTEKRQRFVSLKAYDPNTKSLIVPGASQLDLDYSKPPGTPSGGAGLVSTTEDYARFAQMLLNGGELEGARVLSPAAVKLIRSNLLAEEIRAKPEEAFSQRSGMGFGVDVKVWQDMAKAGSLAGEGSYDWGGAAGTWFWIDPTNDLIFVGMIQVMNRWSNPRIANLDNDTQTLVYQALLHPEK